MADPKNKMLAILPADLQEQIGACLHRERLAAWQGIYEENEPIARVYFPVNGIASIVALTENGEIAECYTAGRDGIAGVEVFYGVKSTIHRSFCQVPGEFDWMEVNDFLRFAENPAFSRTVRLYLSYLLTLAGRAAACNMLHGLTERCARWLLLTNDRVDRDTFELTHDILATMLGVHRPAVTLAAGALQKAGLIRYARGHVTIESRSGLEQASCECYRAVQDEFDRIFGSS